MKVFISWSGPLGKQIARAIAEWLPSALQNVKPWFSDEIEKGANWQNELSAQLKDTRFSIIVLTSDALTSDWIMYEAGATANAVGRTHACPVLFGMQPTDVKGPLASLQLTRFDREDFFKLFKTINSAIGESKLDDIIVIQVFSMWWRNLEDRINVILADAPEPERRPREIAEMLEETLLLVRDIHNIERPTFDHREEPIHTLVGSLKTRHEPPLEVQELVSHPKYGIGEITDIDGAKVTIDFKEHGLKRIVDSFLKRVTISSYPWQTGTSPE